MKSISAALIAMTVASITLPSFSGRETRIHFADITPATVRNVLDAPCRAYWFDLHNAETKRAGAFGRHASRRVAPPTGWEDAIRVWEAGE